MMAFFDEVFSQSSKKGIEQVVMCMPHRGRNNLLTCMLNYPPSVMFRKLKGKYEFPDEFRGTGDVLSHLTSSTDLRYADRHRPLHANRFCVRLRCLFCRATLVACGQAGAVKKDERPQ